MVRGWRRRGSSGKMKTTSSEKRIVFKFGAARGAGSSAWRLASGQRNALMSGSAQGPSA